MKHIHLFQHIGGGCGVGNNEKQGCDNHYKCECGAEFKAYSKSEVHFTMPQFIAGRDEPTVVNEEDKKLK